ncbi:MAG: ABC transporter ATP-binding protein [Chloroherpetonaceae bacterium]|nr:ABC transporter ATP-binding protein [Chloroherpetonaceae bacterium]MDW8437579.1 ABC transporter ATP-binding protein [Chloroherpetonaceae bacterium]
MNVIEVLELSKHYGAKKAVDDISFAVEQGQVFGFLGPNGSGKTTTIGLLLGVINKTKGVIKLFESDDLDSARLRIGATLETPNFYPYLSGFENLKIVAKIKGASEKQIHNALELVGLSARAKSPFRTYSLGMKQRLALAAATLSNPDLVILDEPTNGLDPDGIRDVRQIIKRLADEGKTIFLSSHLLSEVEQVCTHVAVIKNGKLLKSGRVKDLVSRNPFALVRAEDNEKLRATLETYPETLSVSSEGDCVLAELKSENLSALNQFLAERGVFVSHLALRKKSLEEAFVEITQSLN